jgi:hypothetical protein
MKKISNTDKVKLEWKTIQSNLMWIELLDEFHPMVKNSKWEPGETTAIYTSNFDYERLPDNVYRIYIDIVLKVLPHAALCTRTSFECMHQSFSWDDTFTLEHLEPLVEKACDFCIKTFYIQCRELEMDFHDPVPPVSNKVSTISKEFIEMYNLHRKVNDMEYKELMESTGMSMTPGIIPALCTSYTFLIIDEVLYFNPKFKRMQNKENFCEILPEPIYFTIKMKCLESLHKEVDLSLYHTIFYLICLDCALQLLVGDHDSELIARLDELGYNKKSRQLFITEGSKLFKMFNDTIEKPNSILSKFELNFDWNQLIQ